MADRVLPGPVASSACIREAVCINTQKIYDSCREYHGHCYRSSFHICTRKQEACISGISYPRGSPCFAEALSCCSQAAASAAAGKYPGHCRPRPNGAGPV